MDQHLLSTLDICDHRFHATLLVPFKETFVVAMGCVRCSEVTFTKFVDEDKEETSVHESHPALDS